MKFVELESACGTLASFKQSTMSDVFALRQGSVFAAIGTNNKYRTEKERNLAKTNATKSWLHLATMFGMGSEKDGKQHILRNIGRVNHIAPP